MIGGLHGFKSSQGEDSTDLAGPLFSVNNIRFHEFDYSGGGKRLLKGLYQTTTSATRAMAHEIGKEIMLLDEDIVLLVHSHGATMASFVLDDIGHLGIVKAVIVVNGCLSRGYKWPVKVYNYYCPTDKVLTIGATNRARYSNLKCGLKKLFGGECTGNRWGDYGAHPDPHAEHNENTSKNLFYPVKDHSDVWLNKNIGYYVERFSDIYDEVM